MMLYVYVDDVDATRSAHWRHIEDVAPAELKRRAQNLMAEAGG